MKNKLGLFLLCAGGLMAQNQRADLIPFLAVMQPANEVPAITDTSTANAIIWVHVIDNGVSISSGSVDFDISAKFSGAVTVTGLHIHNGATGVAGPVVIPTDLSATNNIAVDASGKVNVFKQVQFPQDSPAVANSTIFDLIANPQNYYVNIHTTDHPGGAMRGQLLRADVVTLMALMSPKNEVPPTPVSTSGIASVVVLRGHDSNGSVAAAEAIFNLQYSGFDAGTNLTGFHIHNGAAGVNGPVIINTGISGANPVTVDASGAGSLNYKVAMTPLDASFANEVATVNGLFSTPQNYYINIHTTAYPGGIMRDQMRSTEMSTLQVNMLPSNETPPVANLAADAMGDIPVAVIRNADGSVAAGTVAFDINYRGFPAPTTITGLHIHQAAVGISGAVVISSGLDSGDNKVVSDSGNGNIFKIVNVADSAGIAALNGLVKDPSGFYVNLHTTVNPGGAIRDQLGAPLQKPAITGLAATSSPVTSAAPGSIISIYGTNLSGYTSDLTGFSNLMSLATSLDGVSVTVGGKSAPLYYVSPQQVNAQVPFEVTPGSQPVVVTTPAGATASSPLTVVAAAPSIVIVATGNLGAVTKNADFSLVTSANPAKGGDVLVVFSTGLGQTTPALETGTVTTPPQGGFNNTAKVTATIGGVAATVLYSIASPGFVGLYQTAVKVPDDFPAGPTPLALQIGGVYSNSVTLPVGQ
jgi:uncharacterized protein (TIGR03437 family)